MTQKSIIEEYFSYQAKKLHGDFERIRSIRNDSDVKGNDNEDIVELFLKENVTAESYVQNVEIIDSTGKHSDEVDICACNRDQPFSSESGQLVIAEGVDFVVQVKAALTAEEIRRSIKNCRSVKSLIRKSNVADITIAHENDIDYFVNRIPYIIFAFSSQVSMDTIHRNIIKFTDSVPLHLQPDALFVLDLGGVINFREGKGMAWTSQKKPMFGYCAVHSGERTLLELVRYITTFVPRFNRLVSPLIHYFPGGYPYRYVGRVAESRDEQEDT
jgi:hypothetical protein